MSVVCLKLVLLQPDMVTFQRRNSKAELTFLISATTQEPDEQEPSSAQMIGNKLQRKREQSSVQASLTVQVVELLEEDVCMKCLLQSMCVWDTRRQQC